MKNLQSLGKILGKVEQKEVFGGISGPERHECDPGSGSGSGVYMSARCQCLSSGHIWNAECQRCETPGEYYFDDGQCGQLFIN